MSELKNSQINEKYFKLKAPTTTLGDMALFMIKSPFLLPGWVVSFLLARNITNIALNPNEIKEQRSIHRIPSVTNHEGAQDVVVNMVPHESYKKLSDYLLKFNSAFFRLPFISNTKRKHLSYDNPSDKAHVDRMIEQIQHLIAGTSTAYKCEGTAFAWCNLHFKGLEFLDEELLSYFYKQLNSQESISQPRQTNLNFFSLEIEGCAVLDSVEVSADDEASKPMSERKFVIACMARDQNYINAIESFHDAAKKIGCTFVGFNYRGVDYSKGMVWTEENMTNDAIVQVQRLVALGVKPENIGLEGMCLGGAVATLAAARLHEQGIKVKLYNERSFRSIPRMVTGYILPGPNSNHWNPINWLRYIAAGVAYIIVLPLIWLSGWHIDAATAWDKIPVSDKDYSVVRSMENLDTLDTPTDDGIIEDSWASMASLVDEKYAELQEKIALERTLTPDELSLRADSPKNHHFKVDPNNKDPHNGHKVPHHHYPQFLVKTEDDLKQTHAPLHMNDHMVKSFIKKFSRPIHSSLDSANISSPSDSLDDINETRRPLFIANSGGGGHISAIMGIIDDMKANNQIDLEITQHQAQLYQNRKRSITGIIVRLSVWLMSVQWVGAVISSVAHFLGYPKLPEKIEFWKEMRKLEEAETNKSAKNAAPVGRLRPYVDVLLDLCPAGYESAAIWNTLQRADQTEELSQLVKLQDVSEKDNYTFVYNKTIAMLIDAAERGEAYSELVSTQSLSLSALCNAVRDYNQNYLAEKNKIQGTSLPQIVIHQYLTDLPTAGCVHFLNSLKALTAEQRNQMQLYAVNFTPAILKEYLNDGRDFQKIHDVPSCKNPMIRAGFKMASLSQYLDKTLSFQFKINEYTQTKGNWIPNQNKGNIEVNAGEKVGTIMLGSLGSAATVSYVKHMLEAGYDKIFVFGGLNNYIYNPIEDIINSYPKAERKKIKQRIIRLGNQSDLEIAPIMTRSNCVVIRGGGLSVMEQMALPTDLNKTVLVHHNDCNNNQELSSGLSWEDENTNVLIAYLQKNKSHACKTSPQLASEHVVLAHQRPYVVPGSKQQQPVAAPIEPNTPEAIEHKKPNLPNESTLATLFRFFTQTTVNSRAHDGHTQHYSSGRFPG